jgi:hypothetical protein
MWWATVTSGVIAGLLGGALLSVVAAGVRARIELVSARTSRRRRILSIMGRGDALLFRGLRDGVFDEQIHDAKSDRFEAMRKEYDDLTVQALELFEPGEERVAFWTMVEFYAGIADPLLFGFALKERLPAGASVRLNTMGGSWGDDGLGEVDGFRLPRVEMLADWVGGGLGPLYGTFEHPEGDSERHRVVPPNTDVIQDMLWPPVIRIAQAAGTDADWFSYGREALPWWQRGIKGRSERSRRLSS